MSRIPLHCVNCGYRVGDILVSMEYKSLARFTPCDDVPENCIDGAHIMCPACNHEVAELIVNNTKEESGGDIPPHRYEFGSMEGGEKDE